MYRFLLPSLFLANLRHSLSGCCRLESWWGLFSGEFVYTEHNPRDVAGIKHLVDAGTPGTASK